MNARTFLSAGALVVIGMIAGRILGMLREMMMAAHFGIGHTGDMAITLMIIPDFITAALIGSAASAALVPAFAARTPDRALALFWQALCLSVAIFTLAVLLLAANHTWLLAQFTHAPVEGATLAIAIALCSIPFSVATAVITAYLQHRGKFLVPAFATVVFNTVIITVLWLGADQLNLLALGIFAASAARFAPHLLSFLRAQEKPRLRFAPWELDRKLVKIYTLSTGSGIFGLLPIYAPYAIVAALGSSIASFNYAFKLVMLPGLLGQSVIQLVVLPWLVAQRQKNTAAEQKNFYSTVLQISWLISLSMALSLSLASHSIATLFFSYGKMTPENIATIGSFFTIGVWAMPGMILLTAWQTIFYSVERPGPPLIVNIAQAALIVPFCWLGHRIAGTHGVFFAFAALQALCTALLAYYGYRAGLTARLIPARASFTMTFAALSVFIPCALVFYAASFSALVEFALAIACGVLTLCAGAATSPAMRQQLKAWIKRKPHENDPHHQRP